MEILLICFAVAYMVTAKFTADTAQAAYKAGKEPPGVEKARRRHARGGGRRSPRTGKPQGPGAARMVAATKWSQSCEKAKDRMEDKHQRWRAWYAEQAPHRDQQWRDKQRKRLEKRADRLDKWQSRWTRTKDAVNPNVRKAETAAWQENYDRDLAADEAATEGEVPDPTPGTDSCAAGTTPGTAAPEISTPSTDTTGGALVYQDAAAQLHNHADEVEGYQNALTMLGDEMEAEGWGAEVHTPLSEMHTSLQQVAGRYRDLAEQIKQQGDNVNDAYDDAPWAPDKAALTR